MRPRVFPAEDAYIRCEYASHFQASMRPRVFPAEDRRGDRRRLLRRAGFNEAAGIPRGRLTGKLRTAGGTAASMRPRVFPAEDAAPSAFPDRMASLQ